MIASWIGQATAAEEKPFKFEILPSEKCVLQKIDPNPDPVLKCLNLKASIPVGVPISPTNPGDPRPGDKLPKSVTASPSEMQTVLDWCKNKSGTWTSDGKDGGTCQFTLASVQSNPIFDRWGRIKTKEACKTEGGVWDGGTGQGGCTDLRKK